MALTGSIALTLLAMNHATASPLQPRTIGHHNNKPCTSFTIPVPITVDQHVYDIPRVDSNIDAVNYEIALDTWNAPSFGDRIVSNMTISKTYDIYATLCVPRSGSKKDILQLATHGGAFDSRYWDSEVEPEKYSYVLAALEQGYSILTYDRLSCGKSAKPDGYTEVQAPAEMEIIRGLTQKVLDGSIASPSGDEFSKIIHVGHSYGSFITYAFTATYPSLSDGAIFTGFIPSNGSATNKVSSNDFAFAPSQDPTLFADSRSGYVVPGTPNSLQFGFFSSKRDEESGLGGFEPKLLDYAWTIRQPITVAEFGSSGLLLAGLPTAPEYKGPVQFNIGEFDMLICGGDCKGTYDEEFVKREMFPKAKGVDVHLQPGTGHGLTLHKGARTGFAKTFEWLERNGL